MLILYIPAGGRASDAESPTNGDAFAALGHSTRRCDVTTSSRRRRTVMSVAARYALAFQRHLEYQLENSSYSAHPSIIQSLAADNPSLDEIIFFSLVVHDTDRQLHSMPVLPPTHPHEYPHPRYTAIDGPDRHMCKQTGQSSSMRIDRRPRSEQTPDWTRPGPGREDDIGYTIGGPSPVEGSTFASMSTSWFCRSAVFQRPTLPRSGYTVW